MFKFDFAVEDAEGEDAKYSTDAAEGEPGRGAGADASDWYDSEEIIATEDMLENIDVCKLNSVEKQFGTIGIRYMVSGFLLEDIKENADLLLDIKKAEEKHSDLITGVYEGGAKIWECTDDLLTYMAGNLETNEWKEKSVLDLGCGSGLLGIYTLKNGARVTFQDYNKDVLEKITIPNVMLNLGVIAKEYSKKHALNKLKENVRFYSGDWTKWCKSLCDAQLYDIILTSETIYNPQNHQKLLNCFYDKLKPNGRIFVAAKVYYFGVGGGVRQFEELVHSEKKFNVKSLWLSSHGVGREIIELTRIKP